ncbi:MAG: AraC family transcriptional regulator [Pyrinomonadaceae bacterium]
MLALEKGTYLGNAVDTLRAEGVIAGAKTFRKQAAAAAMHYHENSHVNFVLQGGVLDKRKTWEVERVPGELMFFHAGEPHGTIIELFPTISINLIIEREFLQDNQATEAAINSAVDRNPQAKFTMLKIYKELVSEDVFSDCSIKMLLLNLIHANPETDSKKPSPGWIKTVAELTRDKWNESLTLKDLSEAAGVHPITVSKHFPKYFSCTFGEYMRRLKIEKSLYFLKVSSFSLTDIAFECGFSDQSHFIRTFKQLTGFLPNNYKKI